MSGQPPSLAFCPLASGSRGNAIYVSDGQASFLLDAGLSGVDIERRMTEKELDPGSLSAIVVSHEHRDHIKGVGVLARRYGLTVHITRKTFAASQGLIGGAPDIRHFETGESFSVGGMTIRAFATSHDARDSSGFTIRKNGVKIGVATDLGIATALVKDHLKGCGLLFLEANHDPDMLMNGPYPWHLKQRVKSRTGHLSNGDCKALVAELLHDGLRHVILGHLSQQNNTPEIALRVVGEALEDPGIRLDVALQDRCGEVVRL